MESVTQAPPSQYGYEPEPAYEPAPAAAPASPVVRRARVGVIALVALVTQIVVIAAADNQWVANRIAKHVATSHSGAQVHLGQSWLSYAWRFSPLSGDHYHVWLSNLLLVLVTIVLSTLLVFAFVRGPVTFFRAFFGVWLAIVAATQVGAVVRGLVNTLPADPSQGSRVIRAMFGSFGPTSQTVWASAALGLVVGLITAIVAVATRRKTGGPAPLAAVAPAPEFPDYVQPSTERGMTPPPWQDRYAGPPAPSDATVGFPRTEPTTRLPDVDASPAYGQPPLGEAFTTELPRVPSHAAAEETTELPSVAPAVDETTQIPVVGGAESSHEEPTPGAAESGPEPVPVPADLEVPTSETPVAAGEIWQWALGRNVWSDPDLQPYTQTLGRTWDTDVNVQSLGFQLTPDAAGAVVAVTVYNDENALGYPGTETNFAAYRGTLPLGLTWAHTATDVEQLLG
ncbi:MAG: hypothetical protein J0H43_16590, partial [Actinobacteria bacterium]|nr:hypothetical protein [Actinomycetota bacterium]